MMPRRAAGTIAPPDAAGAGPRLPVGPPNGETLTEPMRKSQAVTRAAAVGIAAGAATAVCVRTSHPGVGAVLAGTAAMSGWAAFAPRSPVFGPVFWRGDHRGARICLTFDDGPSPSTEAVLDALADADARATFFVLGRQARRHPRIIARMHAEGHQIANHGDDHGILVFRGPRHVAAQLRRAEEAVADAVGADVMSRLFRAPHGFRGPLTWAAARARGYRMAGWTRGVFDSAEPGVDVIVRRCADALEPGAVLLLHDADGWDADRSRPQTAAAVPGVCREAGRRGLHMVTMDVMGRAA